MELKEIAERLAKNENASKVFGCFTKLFIEHADSGDLKQFEIELERDIKTAKRILSYCRISENDFCFAASLFAEVTKHMVEQNEAKRKRKRERQRKRRAARTPEHGERLPHP